ncbi:MULTISPECIES: hypothetical protein [Marinomonas]|uniref:Uncharacterized protein n=1 Tax=Marinomonas rhodophyticola TaxID=2992803 RepID=A0ABT3KKV3_9GAMM|nr:hypothetical protein [Marinomonas sp. KJ51-3]MCW4631188.1 hypothetical protein [Marinomonas sp. KJ51-3]
MTKLLPAKHLLSIAMVSAFLAVVLVALPDDDIEDKNTISLEANFEVIDQSQLMLQDLRQLAPTSNTAVPNTFISTNNIKTDTTNTNTTTTTTTTTIHDIPAPEALVQKSAPLYLKNKLLKLNPATRCLSYYQLKVSQHKISTKSPWLIQNKKHCFK